MNGRMLGAVLAIVGGLILIVAIFLPWYSLTFSSNQSFGGVSESTTGTDNLLPGSSYSYSSSGTCSGSPSCSSIGSLSTSGTKTYSDTHENSTGGLYAALEYLLIGGGILAILGALLAFMATGSRSKWWTPAVVLVLIGMLLGFGAVAYLAADSTAAFKADTTSTSSSNGTGPWSSFIGSCSGNSCGFGGGSGSGSSASWGPSSGFYLGIVGGVLLLVAMIVLWRGKPSSETMEAPASTMDSPSAPMDSSSTSPPMGGGGAS